MHLIRSTWSRVALGACLLLFFAPLSAGASPLDLVNFYGAGSGVGDTTTTSINIAYDQGTGVLTANGTTDGNLSQQYENGVDAFYSYDQDSNPILNVFSLTAQLNPANGALVSGTVTISGDDPYDAPYYNGVLLTGNLTAFGFPNAYSEAAQIPLQLEFQVTGGLLTTTPGSDDLNMAVGGMDLWLYGTSASFASGWPGASFGTGSSNDANAGNSFADTFPVSFTPEPSTFVLLSFGFLSLAWRLRRRGSALT